MPNPLDTLYDQLKGQYPDLVDRSEFIGKLSNEDELKKLHDAASKDIPGFVDFDNFKSKVGESLSTYDTDSDYKTQNTASTEPQGVPTDITIPRREKVRHEPPKPQNGGIDSDTYTPVESGQPTDTHVDAEAFDRETGGLDELDRRYQEKVKRLEGYGREPNLYANEDEARKHYEAYSKLYDEAEQDRLVYNRRVKAAEEERAEQQRQLDLQSKDRKTRRSAEYGGYTNDQVRKEQERLKKERAYLEDPKSKRKADYSKRVMEYNADQTALSGEADKRNKRAENKRAMYDEVKKVAEDPDVQKRITGNDTTAYVLSGNNPYALQNYDAARERAKTMTDEELVDACKTIAGQKYVRGDNKDIYAPLASSFMAYHNELMYRLGGDEPKSALEMRYDMIDKATESSPEGDNFMLTLRNYLDGTAGMGTQNYETDDSERANIPQFAVVDEYNRLVAQKEAENMGKVEQIGRYPQQEGVTDLNMAAAATNINYDAMLEKAFEKFGDANLKAYITAYALRNGISIDEAARRVNQSIWDETLGKTMDEYRPKSGFEFFVRRIFSDNMFSKLGQIGLRARNGTLGSNDPFMMSSMALDEYAKDHPVWDTAAVVTNFAVLEGPIFSGYGKLAGGLVGAGERALIGAALKTTEKEAINKTVRALSQSLMYRLAKGVPTGGLVGFQYGTMSGAIDQAYYDGNVNFGKVIANGLHTTRDFAIMHGVGEVFGVTGDAILRRGQRAFRNGQGKFLNRLETASLDFLNNVAKTTTNAAVVTGLYGIIDKPALERENKKIAAENARLPEDQQKPLNQIASVEDTFYSSLRMFAGLDAVGTLRRAWGIGVRGDYERNKHVKIHFDKFDKEALETAFGKNPNSLLRQIVFGNVDGIPAKWFEIDPEAEREIYKELGRELTPAEKEAYATYGFTELRKVILNKEIPWATRAKIVSVVTGRVVQEPPVAKGDIKFEMDSSGTQIKRIIVKSLDLEGNVIQITEFSGKEFEAARRLYESLNDRGWRNNAMLCGDLVIDAIEDKTYADTVDEMAREKGIAAEQFEQMVFGIKQKDITGEKVTYQERQLVDEFDKRHQEKQKAETELTGPNKLFEQVAREVFGADWKQAKAIPLKSWGEMTEAEKEFVNRYIDRMGAMGVAERNKLMNANPDWVRTAKEYEESVRRRMAEAERPAEAEPLPALEDEKVSVETPAEERVEPTPEVIELEEEKPAEPEPAKEEAPVAEEKPDTEGQPQQGTIGFEPVEQPTERERFDAERKAKAATITDEDIEANREALGIPEGTVLSDEARQIYAEDLAEDLMRYERFKRGESDEKARFHDYWESKFNPKRPKLEKPAEKQEEPVEEDEEEVTEADALIEQLDNLKGRSDLEKYRNALTVFAGDPEIMAILEDLEPRDITEWVSSFLGLDSSRRDWSMLWESKTRGGTVIAKGFKEETGWSWNDVKGFAFMFDNKNGMSPRRVAEKIWEELPTGMKDQYSDVDVFDIMMDLFKSSSRKSDLTNYIRNNRMEQVRDLLNRRRNEELAEIARYKERERRGEEEPVTEPVTTDDSDNEFAVREDEVAPFSLLSLNYRQGEVEGGTIRSRARTRKQIGTIAKALGYKIRWVADKSYNAKIDTDEKVLYLNIRTDQPLAAVMGHEVTHDLRKSDPEAYETLKRYAKDLLGQEQWDNEVKDVTDVYNEEYKRRGWEPIRADKAEEEVVCDTMGKVLHTRKGLRELAGSLDPGVAGKVYRLLKGITDKVKSALGKEHDYETMDLALRDFLNAVEQRAKKDMPIQDAPIEDDFDIDFSLRRKPAPKNTGIGYKVFFLKDGKLYPPMVANIGGEATPFGVWLDADAAPIAGKSKTGRNKVKAGGKGTQGGSGTLAYRPGWHLGKIPYALQFNRGKKVPNPLGILNKKGQVIEVGEFFPNDFVWAEVEYAADKNYQKEAHGYGVNANGKYNPSLAGLPRVPEDGSYEYRTNPNPATDPWIITGAMKVNKILKPSEVDAMVRAAGREPQKRQEGAFTDEQIDALNRQLSSQATDSQHGLSIDPSGGYSVTDKADIESMAPRMDGESEAAYKERIAEIGADENAFVDGDGQFSFKKEDTMRDNSVKYFEEYHVRGNKDRKYGPLRRGSITRQALDKANEMIAEMRDYIAPWYDRETGGNRYLPEEVYGLSTIFDNASYGATLENTLICTRTLAYNDFCDSVKRKLGRPLTKRESFLASQMLYDIATDPQCLYCYVSLDRKAYDEYLLRYFDERDAVIERYNKMGDKSAENIDALYKTFLDGRKDTYQMRSRFNSWLMLADHDSAIGRDKVALSSDRKNALAQESNEEAAVRWRDITKQYNRLRGEEKKKFKESKEYLDALHNYLATEQGQIKDACAYAQGASWAKKEAEYRSYTGELLRTTKRMLGGLASHYGLRFYSFSEYSPAFILENMQMIRDAALRGLKGFAYTKEIDFCKIFLPTGININCSTYGRRNAAGEIVMDERQGANWDEARALRDQYENMGIVFVATDDEMVRWAKEQPWIDVIIPFHIVRTGADIAEFYGWTNYTNVSADYDAQGRHKDIMPPEHNNSIEDYDRLIAERGLTRRFPQFYDGPGDQNYMKLINETRRKASDTPILTPVFNMEEAKKSFDRFVEKGGYWGGFYEVGADDVVRAVDEVAADIEAGKSAGEVEYGRQDIDFDSAMANLEKTRRRINRNREHGNTPKTSFSLKRRDADYEKAVADGDEDAARAMVMEAAKSAMPYTKIKDKNGNPVVLYHGTFLAKTRHSEYGYESIDDEPFYVFETNSISQLGAHFGTRRQAENRAYSIGLDASNDHITGEEYLYSVYLDIHNPIELTDRGKFDFEHIGRDLLEDGYITEEEYDRIASDIVPDRAMKELLKSKGYDGAVYFNEYEGFGISVIAFEPNQIKSAEPATYDDNGKLIPLSQRFNPEKEDIRFSLKRDDRYTPTFYSNAAKAVENVKQNKATAEQWKAMLTKQGGIKAGEDKWMGLSTWLDEHKGETLTKDEVRQFVAENGIEMREVNYEDKGVGRLLDFKKEFNDIADGLIEKFKKYKGMTNEDFIEDDETIEDIYGQAFNEMVERYGDDFEMAFTLDDYTPDGSFELIPVTLPNGEYSDAAKYFLGFEDNEAYSINETRLKYTTNGLENKREIAFVVPDVEPYEETDDVHFGSDTGGKAVMWVRFGETTDTEGNRVLVIDEIQSNRHQDAREKGYDESNSREAQEAKRRWQDAYKEFKDYSKNVIEKYSKDGKDFSFSMLTKEEFNKLNDLQDKEDQLRKRYREFEGGVDAVPSAPFEKNWHEVAMKRMLRLAAEEGFDKVAWTTGDQQTERYGLDKILDEIQSSTWDDYSHIAEGATRSKQIIATDKEGDEALQVIVDSNGEIIADINDTYTGRKLSDVVGKEIADKLLADGFQTVSGGQLCIGGNGMRAFYDGMLPQYMSKYGKRWGVKVGEVTLNTPGRETMHSVDVNEDMRRSVVEQGQPLFSLMGRRGAARLDDADHGGRMDRNVIAEEMEKAGKDARTIKLATGWERGTDGKWRHEEPDGDFVDKGINVDYAEQHRLTLSDIWDSPELFKAYPEFAEIPVEIVNNPLGASATTRVDRSYEMPEFEVYEKFIRDYDQWLENTKKRRDQYKERLSSPDISEEQQEQLSSIIDYLSRDIADAPNRLARLKEIVADPDKIMYMKLYLNKAHLSKDGVISADAEFSGNNARQVVAHEIQHLIQENEGFASGGTTRDMTYGEYRRLAGETEARNVSRRVDMPEYERRRSLASDTEDVPRERQTVRYTSKTSDSRNTAETYTDVNGNEVYTETREDGTKDREITTYGDGSKKALWYDDKGNLKERLDYFPNGEVSQVANYDSDGNLTRNIQYDENRRTTSYYLPAIGTDWKLDENGIARGKSNGVEIKPYNFQFSLKTYHGSAADFDKFDHNFMGSGEGNQAYGWGTYVTEVEGIGRRYAMIDYRRDGSRNHFLYSVEIPDEKEGKYLPYGERVSDPKVRKVLTDRLQQMADEYWNGEIPSYKLTELDKALNTFMPRDIASVLECSDKEVSQLLSKAGYTGVKYVANVFNRGQKGLSYNYVIFNEKDLGITNKEQFSLKREQTHSDNFKRWFGDWENDPENASKVVDAEGKPLVVYRGGEKINIFEPDKASRMAMYGPAFYATPSYVDAQGFGKERTGNADNVQAVYLDIRNPWVDSPCESLGYPKEATMEQARELVDLLTSKGLVDGDIILAKWNDGRVRSLLGALADAKYKGVERGRGEFWHAGNIVQEALKELGYDGVVGRFDGGDGMVDQVAAFDPTQIKSATENNGEFSRENPDIRFSLKRNTAELDKEYVDAIKRGDEQRAVEMLLNKALSAVGITPYIAPHGYGGSHRDIAKRLKTNEGNAVVRAVADMQRFIPDNAVLIPMPPHEGEVTDETDTMILADALSVITGKPVVVALEGEPRESRYAAKAAGRPGITAEEMGFRKIADIPEGKVPIIIDNVVGTGETAKAAVNALGGGITLAYAKATRSKATDGLKNATITYDDNGNVIPLSKRFDAANSDVNYSLKRRRNRDDYTDEDRADAAIIANTYLAQADALRQQIEADRQREHQLVEERNRLLAFDYPAADPADRPAIMDRINALRNQINDLRNANYENNTKLRSMDYEYRVAKEILEQGAVTDEEAARFDAGQMTREEKVLESLFKAAADSRADKKAKQKAIRGLVRELAAITDNFKAAMKARGIESQRKHYDKGTVDHIIRLARAMMGTGYIDNMTSYEVKRLMGMINNAATRESIETQAGRIVDMMLDHQIRTLRNDFDKQLKVTGQKTNSSGVQVQAGLDQEGQVVMEAMRKSMQIIADSAGERYDSNGNITEWGEFYEKTLNDMGDADPVKAEQARKIFEGVWLASKWYEDVRTMEINGRILRSQMEDFKASNKPAKDADADTKQRYADVLADYQEMLRQNKINIIEAYERMTGDVGMTQAESVRRAKEFAEAQKQRVNEIQHNANSDLADVDDNTQVETPESRVFGANKNNILARLLFASAGTYEKFMRFFGRMAPNGEGYLFKRFMTQYHHARQDYWKGRHSAFEEMDRKMAEVFGKKKMHWSDIYEMTRDHKKFPPITVSYWDGYRNGQPRLRMDELNQSEALYLYMINKMPDGRMKLRHMGITDDVVQQMAGQIDRRLITLADWLQSEFLPKMRVKYNETHKRVFGADMAAIEDYFPLRINKLAVASDMDITERDMNDNKPSTITGAIVKRRVNTLPIDLHTDAFDVALSHIDEMEHWSAFAEFNRDNNTLVNYKRFRTKVNNMRSLELGAGNVLWKNFTDAVAIAADAYHPRAGSRSGDHYSTRVAKFVSTAKIALRPYTALKQLLSIPAFWADSDPLEQFKATVNVADTWQWAIENLPGFAERWQSRQAGNIKLANYNDLSGLRRRKTMRKLQRAGMWANAAIDGLACAMGGKAVYETKLKRYRKMGYDEARAQEKALIDAAIAYNNSQQSSEGAYVSPLQVDRTWFANAFSVFRSASMGYTRRLNTSLRQLRNATFKPGYGAQSVEFLKKQMMRDGLTEEQATKWAHRIYRRANLKAAASVAIFGQILPFAWNLGANMFYLLFGDDDKEKEGILADSFRHSFFGPVEGLTGGNVISELGDIAADTAIGNIWGDGIWGDSEAYKTLGYRDFSTMPLSSDLRNLLKYFARDEVKAANEVVNILFQVATGVNPQTITDWATAILDFSRSDMERRDIAMFAMRLLSTPQSQLDKFYLDQINLTKEQAGKMSVDDLIKRYATYKRWRETPLTGWMYSDEREKKVEEKFQKRYEEMLEERSVAEDGLRGAINDIKDLPRKRTMMQKLQKELTDSIEAADPELYKKALEGEKADDDEYVRHVTDKDVEQMAELAMKKKALRAARDRKVKADKDAEAGRITQEEYDAIYKECAHQWKLYNYLNNTLPKKLKEWKLKMEPDMQDKYTPEQVMDTIRSKTDKALQMRPEDMKLKKGDKKKVKKNKKK